MTLRVFCIGHRYRSHRRAEKAYVEVLRHHSRGLARLVEDPAEADISLLHMPPDRVVSLLRAVPALKQTYRIGYFVWEADRSPPERLAGMAAVDEVWTASLYNWHTFSREHPRVRWIPHITDDTVRPTAADVAAMRARLAVTAEQFCVLHIGHQAAGRKNILGLERAFAYLHSRHPEARLILKTTAERPVRVVHRGPVTWIYGRLDDVEVAALYGAAQLYVSPHFSEGWGLTLSDAMQHGVTTVATEYSGNLEFMTPANSLLVRNTPGTIRTADLYGGFQATMRWAYPHAEHLEAQLLCAYDRVRAGTHLTAIHQAKRDLRRFDSRHVAVLVRARLRAIAGRLGG